MNAKRRKTLASIVGDMEAMDALRQTIIENLEAVLDEEQEALDNMPESLQEGERGQQMQEYIDSLNTVLDDLGNIDMDSVMDSLRDII